MSSNKRHAANKRGDVDLRMRGGPNRHERRHGQHQRNRTHSPQIPQHGASILPTPPIPPMATTVMFPQSARDVLKQLSWLSGRSQHIQDQLNMDLFCLTAPDSNICRLTYVQQLQLADIMITFIEDLSQKPYTDQSQCLDILFPVKHSSDESIHPVRLQCLCDVLSLSVSYQSTTVLLCVFNWIMLSSGDKSACKRAVYHRLLDDFNAKDEKVYDQLVSVVSADPHLAVLFVCFTLSDHKSLSKPKYTYSITDQSVSCPSTFLRLIGDWLSSGDTTARIDAVANTFVVADKDNKRDLLAACIATVVVPSLCRLVMLCNCVESIDKSLFNTFGKIHVGVLRIIMAVTALSTPKRRYSALPDQLIFELISQLSNVDTELTKNSQYHVSIDRLSQLIQISLSSAFSQIDKPMLRTAIEKLPVKNDLLNFVMNQCAK